MPVKRPPAGALDLRHHTAPSLRLSIGSIALGLLVVGCFGGSPVSELTTGPTDAPSVDASTPPATETPAATDTPAATLTSAATDTPTAAAPTPSHVATQTPVPTLALCGPGQVVITIVKDQGIYWQGGAGQAMATFQLKNRSGKACSVKKMSQPELINGNGIILIKGAAPGASASLTVAPRGTLKTMVQTGNLCGAPTIVSPTRVAFVLVPGGAKILATPSVDGGVPPCLGDPSIPSGGITMQGWAP